MSQLEDNQALLQTMLASRFISGIRQQVENWDKKLSLMSETLDEWLAVQRAWMYLERWPPLLYNITASFPTRRFCSFLHKFAALLYAITTAFLSCFISAGSLDAVPDPLDFERVPPFPCSSWQARV